MAKEDLYAAKRAKAQEQVKLELLKQSVVWKKAFGTEDGQKCLALLKEHYYDVDVMAHENPTVTQNRAAKRDLVRDIIRNIEFTGE